MSPQGTLPALPRQEGVEFRHIPGAPGYCAGDDGSIWTAWLRKDAGKHWRPNWARKATVPDSGGYPCVSISRDGRKRRDRVHVLIVATFVGPSPQPNMEICHDNGDPNDNRAANLSWGTHRKNGQDMVRHGRSLAGEKSHSAKLTETQVREARARMAAGESPVSVAADLGIDASHAYGIKRRRFWKGIK